MSTRTQRQSSLSSLSEAKQIVDGIPLGPVDPKQVVQVARRVYEGGGVQRRFQELCISGAPYTSFPSEGDGPQTVRQVTALLGHLDTIDISSLKPSACGCFIPAAPGSLITFCKGSCDLDEDDDVSKCVECGTALSTRRLRCSGCRWGGLDRARNGHGVVAQCATPCPPPTPAAAGRGGCGVDSQPNHS